MPAADSILPQNGLPITDIVVTHTYNSGLFRDLRTKYLCSHITKGVGCYFVDPLAHLLQWYFSIKNQELLGWCQYDSLQVR